MALYNYNNDETRLGRGLGQVLEPENTVYQDNKPEYTDYEEVQDADIRTMSPDVAATMLPALNYATGVSSCVDCTTSTASATGTPTISQAATAAATAAAVVTPMPAAPKTVNYLLIIAGLGLGYALLKSGSSAGLGCAPEPEPAPAPTEQPALGRLPRKRKANAKHVDTLSL